MCLKRPCHQGQSTIQDEAQYGSIGLAALCTLIQFTQRSTIITWKVMGNSCHAQPEVNVADTEEPRATEAAGAGAGADQPIAVEILQRLVFLETRKEAQLDQLTTAHEERITAIKV